MNKQTRLIAQSFNKAANTYNQYATMQSAAGIALIHHLTAVHQHFANVLDAGCGTGMTTAALANSIRYEKFTAVDTADVLLKNSSALPDHIHRLNIDFNEIKSLSEHYDLIFSNMAMHWSHSFSETLGIFNDVLTRNGILAFTIPLQGTFVEIDGRLSVRQFLSMNEVTSLITKNKLDLLHHSALTYRQQFDDTPSALRSIKSTGVNYVSTRSHQALRGKSFLQSLSINQLSYVTGFFIGRKSYE